MKQPLASHFSVSSLASSLSFLFLYYGPFALSERLAVVLLIRLVPCKTFLVGFGLTIEIDVTDVCPLTLNLLEELACRRQVQSRTIGHDDAS